MAVKPEPKPARPDVRKAAEYYVSRGLRVIPLKPETKLIDTDGWPELVFKPDDFRPDDNLGIRLTKGMADVDCDAAEVAELAPKFLPFTARYGRPSKRFAHWLYKSQIEKTTSFKDLAAEPGQKVPLLELRVEPNQAMAPPSVHPDTKEVLEWSDGPMGDLTAVAPSDLLRACRLLATAALLARHYNPGGNRHDWMLALSGFFRCELELTRDEAIKVVTNAAALAGDSKLRDRLSEVNATYRHTEGDEHIAQAGTVRKLMARGPDFVKTLRTVWGIGGHGAFILDEKGERIVANSQQNIARALQKLAVELRFDTFNQKAMVTYDGQTLALEDAIATHLWLEIDARFRFRPSKDFFYDVVWNAAGQQKYHPVQDYLTRVTWDGVLRLDTWLIRTAGALDTEYVRAVSAIVLMAAVRRLRSPGCKYDELLVLESDQGLNKSSALRVLCPNEDWFSDDLPLGVESKQVIERTTGKWFIEAAELAGRKHRDIEHLKSFLSRQVDGPCRLAYARLPESRPRQFIIVGTTNSHAYLEDATGNRRFWPVRVGKFNLETLRAERDQLWAEAAHREATGASIRLPESLWKDAELQQEERRIEDAWESVIREAFPGAVQRVAPEQLWDVLGIAKKDRDAACSARIAMVMQRLGFRRLTVRHNGVPVKGYGKGDARQAQLDTGAMTT